jgi:hypothetical protein
LLTCTRILFFVGAHVFLFQQHLLLPFSPCHTNATDCNYTQLPLCMLNFLLCDQPGDCIETWVSLRTACQSLAGHSGCAVWGVGLDRLVAGIVGLNPAQSMDVCPRLSVLLTNHIFPRQCNHNESITLMVKLQVSTTSRCNNSFNIAQHVSTIYDHPQVCWIWTLNYYYNVIPLIKTFTLNLKTLKSLAC